MGANAEYQHVVYIISDATGATGRRVVEAALAQFADAEVDVVQIPGVREVDAVKRIVGEAARARGTIVHTLASPELRQMMLNEGRRCHVVTIDLLGPLVARLSDSLELAPLAKPGLLQQIDETYIQRIEAIDFAVRHDDGRHPEDLPDADLVLVGVSRTSKTPISIFLAYRGWRVANVPIVINLEPPAALFRVDRQRVIALTIQPERLVNLRRARMSRLARGYALAYADMEHIVEELDWAELIVRRERWPVVDVTHKSIEEVASEIIDLQGRRTGPGPLPERPLPRHGGCGRPDRVSGSACAWAEGAAEPVAIG